MLRLTRPLCFFDLETTGVSTEKDRIVQIAITKVFPDLSRESKSIIINPGIPIPKEASDVHGITDEDVQDCPTFKQISKSLKGQMEDCDLGGFNSNSFDIPMLSAEFQRVGINFPDEDQTPIDSCVIERIVNSNKLSDTYKRYTGKDLENAHDAEADTNATVEVFLAQLGKLKEMIGSDNETFDGKLTPKMIDQFCQGDQKRFDFAGKAYEKDGTVFWSFGKCMNRPVLEDRSYLSWVLTSDFPLETKNKLKALLEAEKKQTELL